VIYYVTHTSLRYRHPIDPMVLLLVAIFFAAVVQNRSTHAATAAQPS
jgi:hypothetical protein